MAKGAKLATEAAGVLLRGVKIFKGGKIDSSAIPTPPKPKYPYSKLPDKSSEITAPPGFTPKEGRGGPPGSRRGENFTPAGKDEVKKRNAHQHPTGRAHCASCSAPLVRPEKSARGHRPPDNEVQIDHVWPKSKNGSGDPSNGDCLCRVCNRAKSDN